MGGFGSGRHATKACVEDGFRLDLGRLLRTGAFVPGARTEGRLHWTTQKTGKRVATIGYLADLIDRDCAQVRFDYSVNKVPQNYEVGLVAQPCRFGGFRWWWICPRTAYRASKLYLPSGATVFASRRAYRMAYESERGGAMDRSHSRQARIFDKLGDTYRSFEQCPPKRRKGMHNKTYEKLLSDLDWAERNHNKIFVAGATKIIARIDVRPLPSLRAKFIG